MTVNMKVEKSPVMVTPPKHTNERDKKPAITASDDHRVDSTADALANRSANDFIIVAVSTKPKIASI